MPSLPALDAARTGIDLLLQTGIQQIAGRVSDLVAQCIEGLSKTDAQLVTSADPTRRAGVVVVRADRATDILLTCRSQGVDIGVVRGMLRIDPHGFNNAHDLDRALACLSQSTRSSVANR
jgi:cysteine desulfurase / selenocysteine lyase